jgi:hypothetical protein
MPLLTGSRATFRGVCHNDSEVEGGAAQEGLANDTRTNRSMVDSTEDPLQVWVRGIAATLKKTPPALSIRQPWVHATFIWGKWWKIGAAEPGTPSFVDSGRTQDGARGTQRSGKARA